MNIDFIIHHHYIINIRYFIALWYYRSGKQVKSKDISNLKFDIALVSAFMMCGMVRSEEGPEFKTFKFGDNG
jgi:hypothetical protein